MRSVIVRADASATIGTGHVVRCVTLAEALRRRGRSVSFVCREQRGHLCDLIEERGFAVHRLRDHRGHAAGWEDDAEQTCAAISGSGEKPEWLVVDQYALDGKWEGALRESVGRIMVIDDLADRGHDCDLLLDQNLVEQMHRRYLGRVPQACTTLLGPEYALLQPAYAELHGRVRPREGSIRRILIFFGGSDADHLISLSLSAFLSLNRTNIQVDVVMGSESSSTDSVRQQAATHPNGHLHGKMPTLAPLMGGADLAIGAGGATTWERLCLGLPSLVVTLAENQRPIAEALSRRGLIRWLGHMDNVTETAIATALEELIRQGLDRDWSERCSE